MILNKSLDCIQQVAHQTATAITIKNNPSINIGSRLPEPATHHFNYNNNVQVLLLLFWLLTIRSILNNGTRSCHKLSQSSKAAATTENYPLRHLVEWGAFTSSSSSSHSCNNIIYLNYANYALKLLSGWHAVGRLIDSRGGREKMKECHCSTLSPKSFRKLIRVISIHHWWHDKLPFQLLSSHQGGGILVEEEFFENNNWDFVSKPKKHQRRLL